MLNKHRRIDLVPFWQVSKSSLLTQAFTTISRSTTFTREQRYQKQHRVGHLPPKQKGQQVQRWASKSTRLPGAVLKKLTPPRDMSTWGWAQRIPFSRLGFTDGISVLREPRHGKERALDVKWAGTHMSGGHKSLPGRRQCLSDKHADCTPSSETPLSLLVIKGVRKVKKIYKPN